MGKETSRFRTIQAAAPITREKPAALLVRHFPQSGELPRTPQVFIDTENSWSAPEIQTEVDLGILVPMVNHAFQSSRIVTHGEFAIALSRLTASLAQRRPEVP
jgi:hypothetical protein